MVASLKIKIMGRSTSIALGEHFERFIEHTISNGRFTNASEVIKAGLGLLEEEIRIYELRKAIQEGIDCGIAKDFEPTKFLESLKARKK